MAAGPARTLVVKQVENDGIQRVFGLEMMAVHHMITIYSDVRSYLDQTSTSREGGTSTVRGLHAIAAGGGLPAEGRVQSALDAMCLDLYWKVGMCLPCEKKGSVKVLPFQAPGIEKLASDLSGRSIPAPLSIPSTKNWTSHD